MSLDQPAKSGSRAMGLFERMADRLDEIAANTRGGIATMAQARRCNIEAPESVRNILCEKPRKERQPTIRPVIAHQVDKSATSPGASQKTQASSQGKTKNQPVVARVAHNRSANKAGNQDKSEGNARSADALDMARDAREADATGSRIEDAIENGMAKLGNLAKLGGGVIAQESDAKDAAGYALGGPLYGAMKDLKDAMPSFDLGKHDKEGNKAQAKEIAKAIEGQPGRRRDEKGRFTKPDQNAIRRQTAQTEVIHDQLDLEETEAKKEAKRHKELVRAVKNNRRGMLDKFLDRRAARGGRGLFGGGKNKEIIRERNVAHDARRRRDFNGEAGGRNGRAGRRSGRQGILSRTGGGLAKTGGAVAGGLMKGIGALGGILAKAAPMLAGAMAIYDGFKGWNDTELHKKAFGLKDGQEATTGQKASAAAASILDMGGLTSSFLEMFGIEFDKAGVTKSIYEFGSNIATVAQGFLTEAGPILSNVWGGMTDLAGKAWQGAKDFGAGVANFATGAWEKGAGLVSGVASFAAGVWEKGQNFVADVGNLAVGVWEKGTGLITGIGNGICEIGGAIGGFAANIWSKGGELASSVAGWATSAIQEGAGILTGIWKGASETVGGIWANLTGFASNALEKAGQVLSDMWKGITELPGKLIDGAKDMAKNAVEGGGKLLSDGWKATKDFVGSLWPFGSKKAEAAPVQSDRDQTVKPVSKAEIVKTEHEKAVSDQINTEASIPPTMPPVPDAKLLQGQFQDVIKKIPTSSEAASGALALEQMNLKQREDKNQSELSGGLENITGAITRQTKLFEERWRKEDAEDPYVIDQSSQSGNTTIVTQAPVVSSPTTYGERGAGTTQTQYETSSQTGGSTGTLSQRNLSVFNYGNVKLNSKEYKAYASAKDGLMDVGARVLRYNNAPERGWNAKTLQEMINIYAPPSENDSKGYAQFLAKKLGVDKDQQIDFRDPKILAGLIRWMPKMEHGADIDEKTALDAAEATLRGERAKIVGTAPDKQGNYKKFTEKGTVSVDNSGQALRYNAASQGVRLKADGKTVDLSTVKGVDSLKLQQGVNIDKMHPEVVANMAAMAQAYEEKTGEKLEISEGYRDYAEQVRVKQKYGSRAATPGRSTHGAGNTFDIASSKIDRVMANLQSKGIDPVQFFRDYGFERSAYNANKDKYHDERWHLESIKHRSAQFNADRAKLQSGTKTGAEYMTGEERSKYMAAPAQSTALAENKQQSANQEQLKANPDIENRQDADIAEAQAAQAAQSAQAVDAKLAAPSNEELEAARAKVAEAQREFENTGYNEADITSELRQKVTNPKNYSGRIDRHTYDNDNAAIWAYDDLKEARENLAKLEAQQKEAQAAQASSAQAQTQPQSLAQTGNQQLPESIARMQMQPGAAAAINTRQPERPESVREINPEREPQQKGQDITVLAGVLGEILQAIQSGNDKLASAIQNAIQSVGSQNNIGMDYGDSASRNMANG